MTADKNLVRVLFQAALSVSLLCLPLATNATGSGFAASDVLGQLTAGNPDFTIHPSGVSATALSYPDGTALDAVHHLLYVDDSGNNRILVYNLDANNDLASHAAVHVLGPTDLNTAPFGTTSQSMFSSPYAALAYDSVNNRLFVSDNGNRRVLVFDLASGLTDGMLASYVIGSTSFSTDTSTSDANGMERPEGLAFDPVHQRLFVSDYDLARIAIYDVAPADITSGESVEYVIGQTDPLGLGSTTLENGLHFPEAIAYNPTTQQLFVGDSRNYRVTVYNLATGITDGMNASYVLGQADLNSNSNTVTLAQNNFGSAIEGMGVDPVRNLLYVYDDVYNRILVFDLAAGIANNMNASMVIGQPDYTSSDYSCVPSSTSLCDSEGNITVDSANDRIYVPDAGNNRVLVYNFDHITTPAGALTAGTLGEGYDLTIPTSGAKCAQSISLTGGSLPPGLSLNTAAGQITGTPTTPGTYNFDLTLTDTCGTLGASTDDPAYSITVSPAAPDTGVVSAGFVPQTYPF